MTPNESPDFDLTTPAGRESHAAWMGSLDLDGKNRRAVERTRAIIESLRDKDVIIGDVPNQPKTPQRTVRVPDDVWDRAKARAEERGETVSDVVRRALERYGRAK